MDYNEGNQTKGLAKDETDEVKSAPQRASLPKRIIGKLLRKTGYTLTRVVPQTKLVCQHIPGWFSISEAEALYLLAATSSASRILEIGHFLGRSTSVVCEAIRDTDRSAEFNSYDLGFSNAEEFLAHYRRIYASTSTQIPPECEQWVFSQGQTTTEIAKRNLERFNLGRFVNLIRGDFTILDQTRYGLIFCDALHDDREIAVNLPHVVAASDDACIWAFHDMNPLSIAHVLKQADVHFIRLIDTLGIFRFQRHRVNQDNAESVV